MMESTKTKLNFFKRVWYSVAKVDKYEIMREEGLGRAIRYFLKLVSLLAIILAIIATVLQTSATKDIFSYLEENIPNVKYKDNLLTTPDNKATILNDEKFLEYFKNIVVINPSLEKQEAIDKYKSMATDRNNVIIFIKDQIIAISNKYNKSNNNEGIEIHTYNDMFGEQIKDNSKEYGKADIMAYLKTRTSFSYFLAQFFISYLLSIAVIYLLYILIIALCLWVVIKLLKIKWILKSTLIYTFYSSTLSILIYVLYLIISYFAKFTIPYMDMIIMSLIFIHIFLLLLRDKKKILKKEAD